MEELDFSPESRLFYKNRLLLPSTVVSYYHDYQSPRQACAADQLSSHCCLLFHRSRPPVSLFTAAFIYDRFPFNSNCGFFYGSVRFLQHSAHQ